MASSGFDTYIADTQFRSRNPLFKESETYHTEKEKRRLKRRNGNRDSLPHKTFITIKTIRPAAAQQVT
jgi:nicotinamide mononucleotide adenylyltransferase